MHQVIKKIVSGIAAMAAALGCVIAVGQPAAADGKWCNHSVCIETYDSGTYLGRVEVSVTNTNQPHRISARVWTTNGWSANTKVEDVAAFRTYRDQAYPQRHFPAGTRLCAEGFRGGASVGLPCVTITS
ncbi:hypothetical protein SLINC_7642 [Streptomyces lincolnensis]|uniref:Uncharacterized protein n=1 Tax=Streptomyces lincolnensis TaxID=1915 RepID=A0A1B1MMN5_STRLN|nr:hypothetical protein [Streptomyces lincolnensis]ANS69866.1 hypothetical protein SLINC_7642 [Streptomyces lincolnensis]AXG58784.1 hypothetical protein SLCG_7629 [Streptomyces lincolnensis]QMV11402.1 hypothetical protein GJU35_40810 [Streptomyces lincolnensis]